MTTFPHRVARARAAATAACLAAGVVVATAGAQDTRTPRPADELVAHLDDPALERLAAEALEQNPGVAAARARARAAWRVAPQVSVLPDPQAMVTAYLLEPETRVGPQRVGFSYSQRFPWAGTLGVRERAAVSEALAAEANVEAARLRVLTDVRRWHAELAFLAAEEELVREERAILVHFEELARSRYAAGIGLQQAPMKLQAEITRADLRLLQVERRRRTARAALNSLRDAPGDAPLVATRLPPAPESLPRLDDLRQAARARRPEVAAADAVIAATEARVELARKRGRPDLVLGVTYTVVGHRQDEPGRLNPPPDDGDDVLALNAGASLPVWRGKVRAGVQEAAERRQAAGHERQAVLAGIERELADLVGRFRTTRAQLELLDGVLVLQADQALDSVLAAYTAGSADALDLLDSERVLFQVRLAAERARTDLAVTAAQLEGATGRPLDAADAAPARVTARLRPSPQGGTP